MNEKLKHLTIPRLQEYLKAARARSHADLGDAEKLKLYEDIKAELKERQEGFLDILKDRLDRRRQ